jgi:hypothetical protein
LISHNYIVETWTGHVKNGIMFEKLVYNEEDHSQIHGSSNKKCYLPIFFVVTRIIHSIGTWLIDIQIFEVCNFHTVNNKSSSNWLLFWCSCLFTLDDNLFYQHCREFSLSNYDQFSPLSVWKLQTSKICISINHVPILWIILVTTKNIGR